MIPEESAEAILASARQKACDRAVAAAIDRGDMVAAERHLAAHALANSLDATLADKRSSRVISNKAIEAAAKVMAGQADEPPYGSSPEMDAEYRRDACSILEEAAPHMQRSAVSIFNFSDKNDLSLDQLTAIAGSPVWARGEPGQLNAPLEKAVAASIQYAMKKLTLSATYLADFYKVDVEEVKEMLVNGMERRFDKFWEDDNA